MAISSPWGCWSSVICAPISFTYTNYDRFPYLKTPFPTYLIFSLATFYIDLLHLPNDILIQPLQKFSDDNQTLTILYVLIMDASSDFKYQIPHSKTSKFYAQFLNWSIKIHC